MTPHFDQLFLLGVFSASIHWLIARSLIAKPLWSRARGVLAELLACPSCSGFWIGLGLAAIGLHVFDESEPLGFQIAAGGLLGIALTPVMQAVILWGLERTAIQTDVEPTDPK
jgi:hypothetical protein